MAVTAESRFAAVMFRVDYVGSGASGWESDSGLRASKSCRDSRPANILTIWMASLGRVTQSRRRPPVRTVHGREASTMGDNPVPTHARARREACTALRYRIDSNGNVARAVDRVEARFGKGSPGVDLFYPSRS